MEVVEHRALEFLRRCRRERAYRLEGRGVDCPTGALSSRAEQESRGGVHRHIFEVIFWFGLAEGGAGGGKKAKQKSG